jgi:hypothetical protein
MSKDILNFSRYVNILSVYLTISRVDHKDVARNLRVLWNPCWETQLYPLQICMLHAGECSVHSPAISYPGRDLLYMYNIKRSNYELCYFPKFHQE